MMYGFGDDINPYPETVDLVEKMVINFVTGLAKKAGEMNDKGAGIHVQDLMFLLRNDRKKFSRAKELLMMEEEIRKARKAFDTADFSKE